MSNVSNLSLNCLHNALDTCITKRNADKMSEWSQCETAPIITMSGHGMRTFFAPSVSYDSDVIITSSKRHLLYASFTCTLMLWGTWCVVSACWRCVWVPTSAFRSPAHGTSQINGVINFKRSSDPPPPPSLWLCIGANDSNAEIFH